MGRRTFQSIGKPLPHRRNIVITRSAHFQAEGIEVVTSMEEALALCKNEDEVFFIGGGEIYRQILPRTDRIYLTQVDTSIDADTFFPELDMSEWHVHELERHSQDEKHAFDFTFFRLDRVL